MGLLRGGGGHQVSCPGPWVMRGAQKDPLKGAQCSLGKSIQTQEGGIYNINWLITQTQALEIILSLA